MVSSDLVVHTSFKELRLETALTMTLLHVTCWRRVDETRWTYAQRKLVNHRHVIITWRGHLTSRAVGGARDVERPRPWRITCRLRVCCPVSGSRTFQFETMLVLLVRALLGHPPTRAAPVPPGTHSLRKQRYHELERVQEKQLN